jgi:hypothetical protein
LLRTRNSTGARPWVRNRNQARPRNSRGREYKPLFTANEDAFELVGEKLKGLISQVAGTDDEMTARIANTFSTLIKNGDFKATSPALEAKTKMEKGDENDGYDKNNDDGDDGKTRRRAPGLRPEFQYVIQIQLPSNGSEETYLNIFNAIRKTFQ